MATNFNRDIGIQWCQNWWQEKIKEVPPREANWTLWQNQPTMLKLPIFLKTEPRNTKLKTEGHKKILKGSPVLKTKSYNSQEKNHHFSNKELKCQPQKVKQSNIEHQEHLGAHTVTLQYQFQEHTRISTGNLAREITETQKWHIDRQNSPKPPERQVPRLRELTPLEQLSPQGANARSGRGRRRNPLVVFSLHNAHTDLGAFGERGTGIWGGVSSNFKPAGCSEARNFIWTKRRKRRRREGKGKVFWRGERGRHGIGSCRGEKATGQEGREQRAEAGGVLLRPRSNLCFWVLAVCFVVVHGCICVLRFHQWPDAKHDYGCLFCPLRSRLLSVLLVILEDLHSKISFATSKSTRQINTACASDIPISTSFFFARPISTDCVKKKSYHNIAFMWRWAPPPYAHSCHNLASMHSSLRKDLSWIIIIELNMLNACIYNLINTYRHTGGYCCIFLICYNASYPSY